MWAQAPSACTAGSGAPRRASKRVPPPAQAMGSDPSPGVNMSVGTAVISTHTGPSQAGRGPMTPGQLSTATNVG